MCHNLQQCQSPTFIYFAVRTPSSGGVLTMNVNAVNAILLDVAPLDATAVFIKAQDLAAAEDA